MNHEIHPSPLHYAVAGERREKIIFKERSYAIQDAIFELRKMGSNLINEINKMKFNKTIFLNNIFVLLACHDGAKRSRMVKSVYI